MQLIVGLGNPGGKYARTRHNIGYDVADLLVSRADGAFKKPWLSPGLTADIRIGDERAMVLKPTTFMNDSGRAVAPLAKKTHIAPGQIVVVLDDVDLDCGTLRIRKQGGAGGHNGLQSIIQHLGTREFPRLRVGVGPRPPGADLAKFVLGTWPRSLRDRVRDATERAADALETIVLRGLDTAMNQYNQPSPSTP